ncbi:MAG: LacI family DNA-binding transcriptional regulator [Streptosporangiaceae bacterium]
MGRSTSIREVAARAGVSVGTVSNVLNHPDLVSEGTRGRVLAAIDDLGFVRNESARQLRAGRSRTIGLVVLDVANPFFTDVARGVSVTAGNEGLAVILCSSDDSGESERRYLALLEEQRVQALLITPIDVSHERLVQLHRRGMAVVLLDRQSSRSDQCSVSIDDIAGGDLAASHLLRKGHRAFTYVTGPLAIKQCRDRREGAVRALRRASLSEDALAAVEQPAMNAGAGRDAGRRLLASGSPPTAVFCANDLLALGVMRTLLEDGVGIPKDTAVVGYDDIEFAASAAVPMTSVRQPRLLLGQTAAEPALNEAEDTGHHTHRHVVFQPELIVREST